MKDILYVGYRDNRHSSAGGYDKIAKHPNADYLSDLDVSFHNIPIDSKFKVLNFIALEIYSRKLFSNYKIVHYFYGDALKFPFCKKRNNKIIATIHLDIDKKKKFRKLFFKYLKSLDAIVVLSSNQQKIFREKYKLPAFFIPHGFDLSCTEIG